MSSINSSNKCCATCANWSGPRQVNSTRTQVIVPDPKPSAKCYLNSNVGGFAYGPKADWCSSSCGYTKWSALK